MSTVTFFLGFIVGIILSLLDLFVVDDIKKTLWVIPFFFLVAAAVAKYLGM